MAADFASRSGLARPIIRDLISMANRTIGRLRSGPGLCRTAAGLCRAGAQRILLRAGAVALRAFATGVDRAAIHPADSSAVAAAGDSRAGRIHAFYASASPRRAFAAAAVDSAGKIIEIRTDYFGTSIRNMSFSVSTISLSPSGCATIWRIFPYSSRWISFVGLSSLPG